MDVPLTSKSQLSNRFGPSALAGSVVPRESLSLEERDRMYRLLSDYFIATCPSQFAADLEEKESVVLLRDAHTGEIQGFSTYMRMELQVDGCEIVAFFSGDTIIAREYWGETILSRLWSRTVFAEADRVVAVRPKAHVLWFLICSGYKTYRFLPVFFERFFPNPETATPHDVQRILDGLGAARFGDRYNPDSGLVRLARATPLRPGIADITGQRLRDPMVAFFKSRNPGHAQGDELACVTEISRSNLTRAGARMVGSSPVFLE
jgi:hypothetical protein